MLYDPKWETTVAPITKPNIHALPTLIAWLEKQPAERAYPYTNFAGLCLLGQYWAAHGFVWCKGIYGRLQDEGKNAWGWDIAAQPPYTFGAALSRARALLPTRAEEASKS